MKPFLSVSIMFSTWLLSVPLYAHIDSGVEQMIVTPGEHLRTESSPTQTTQVLSNEFLKQQSGHNAAALLSNTPGISNSSFGPGVGRPVIRGMSGNRVRVLQNGSDAADVSAMSSDHSPMADTSNADQLEVIYGPSTLMYGSGAIGGIINVVDGSLRDKPFKGFTGNVSAGVSSVDQGFYSKALMNAGNGPWVLHADTFYREAKDYSAYVNGRNRRIHNSDNQGQGGKLGLSHINQKGFIGFSIAETEYDYAIPNADGENARISPTQTRIDIQSGLFNLNDVIDQWTITAGYSDYEHQEKTDHLVEGLFEKNTLDLKSVIDLTYKLWQANIGVQFVQKKLDLCHNHVGCNSIANYSHLPWNGDKGTNFTQVGGYDFAHDTPMPSTETTDIGAFVIQRVDWQQGIIELGIRVDQRTLSSDPSTIRPAARQDQSYYSDKTFTPTSINFAGTWVLDTHTLLLSLARAQRAPEAEELFWNGDHHSTFSYQLDNPDLSNETAYTIDISWEYLGDFQSRVNVYHYDFRGYIYNEKKSVTDPFHGDAVYRHEQRDAQFSGIEGAINLPLTGLMQNWYFDIFGDVVNARLNEGKHRHLPRTPPASLGAALHWQNDSWFFQMDSRAYARQNKVAENESKTGSFITLNSQVAWFYHDLRIGVKANNLTNETGFNHVSLLKEVAPVPGRNLMLDISWDF